MPYIRFKGFEESRVKKLTPTVVKEFSLIVLIEQEKVKIEVLNVRIITDTPLSVEIMMFQRDQETHDKIAASLHCILQEHGYPSVHIFFITLDSRLYYKEGRPLR